MTNKEIMLAEMVLAERDNKGFYIQVDSPDFEKPELIINLSENLSAKRAYYQTAYNDSLQLVSKPAIKIVAFGAYSTAKSLPKEYFPQRYATNDWDLLYQKGADNHESKPTR